MNKFNMFITAVCVLFLIKLRWPKNKSIYAIVLVRRMNVSILAIKGLTEDIREDKEMFLFRP